MPTPHADKQSFWSRIAANDILTGYYQLAEVYFFAKDADGRFTAGNPALLRALGLRSESELLGRTDYDFFEVRLADAYREEDRTVMAAAAPVVDQIWHVPDQHGRLNWFVSSKYPLRAPTGDTLGIIGIMRDSARAAERLSPFAQLAPVLNHVAGHYHQPLRVPELARMAHLSLSQFERTFRKTIGLTPAKYLTKVRLDAASNLLVSTSAGISAIAIDCGFYDHSHFSRQFRRAFAQSPTAYRNRYKRAV